MGIPADCRAAASAGQHRGDRQSAGVVLIALVATPPRFVPLTVMVMNRSRLRRRILSPALLPGERRHAGDRRRGGPKRAAADDAGEVTWPAGRAGRRWWACRACRRPSSSRGSDQGGSLYAPAARRAQHEIQAHSHPDDRVATVVSGDCYFGYGKEFDETALKHAAARQLLHRAARRGPLRDDERRTGGHSDYRHGSVPVPLTSIRATIRPANPVSRLTTKLALLAGPLGTAHRFVCAELVCAMAAGRQPGRCGFSWRASKPQEPAPYRSLFAELPVKIEEPLDLT